MRCPKCGSELRFTLNGDDTKYDYQCLVCDKEYGITNSDTFEYQQKLEKVLSKLDGNVFEIDKYTTIDYINDEGKRFVLTTYSCVHKISLKTVESILEDLSNE